MADIYALMENGCEVSKESADQFGSMLSAIISARLAETTKGERAFTLRMSNVGKGTRQIWYDKNYGKEEKLDGQTLLKFMLGDVVEALLLHLAGLAGHTVTHQQDEVTLGGVKGHIDAEIDGVTVDVKSASPHAFRKFANGTLVENDAFGYVEQLSGYCAARGTDGAFLAMEKVTGELALLRFAKEELAVFKVEDRIEFQKAALASETVPARCHSDEEYGASGNMALGVNCSYCPHKKRCWADANNGMGLRTFLYSNKPVFMTKVVREPKVYEVPPF